MSAADEGVSIHRATDPRRSESPGAARQHKYLWVDACGWV